MYTRFKKGKMVLRSSNDYNCASAIFFHCPACRLVTLAFIATVIQFNFEKLYIHLLKCVYIFWHPLYIFEDASLAWLWF